MKFPINVCHFYDHVSESSYRLGNLQRTKMEGKDKFCEAATTNLNEKKGEKVEDDNCQAGLDYSAQQIIKCRPWSVQGDRKVKVETQNIFMNNFSK